ARLADDGVGAIPYRADETVFQLCKRVLVRLFLRANDGWENQSCGNNGERDAEQNPYRIMTIHKRLLRNGGIYHEFCLEAAREACVWLAQFQPSLCRLALLCGLLGRRFPFSFGSRGRR